jgi:pterin-4a-carbinolamine dehydratase
VVGDFGTGARFVAAVAEAGDALGHHPRVTIGDGYVDLKLISDDADLPRRRGRRARRRMGHPADVDLARRITEIAAEQAVDADPASITTIELALDTAHAATIAPVWAALLTGSTEARAAGPSATTSGTPPGGYRSCGSRTPTSTRPRVSGSTSTSGCRPRWPSSGSPPPSPRVGSSSTTARRPRSP